MTDFTMPTYHRWPVKLVSGSGARVTDSRGRTYIDLVAGIATASLGHGHPGLARAVAEQAAVLVHVSNLYGTGPQARLAERLAKLTGGMLSFLCNSGAEAVECALKIARKRGARAGAPGRIVSAWGGFHGRTFGALSATGQRSKQAPFGPLVPGFDHVPYGDTAALSSAVDDDVAAVVLEPIQGENGVVVPPAGYLAEARRICDAHGALLVLDEIQTGVGRTGTWFACEHEGVRPDVMCLAKGLGGGLPVAACLAIPAVAQVLAPGDHGSTFGGGPVQCAAAMTVLDAIEGEGLLRAARELGERLMAGLRSMPGPIAEVRGRGLLIGVRLHSPLARSIAERALEAGVLVNDCGSEVVRLCPPLVITTEDVDEALAALQGVFGEVAAA